jgi:hypothetical protein
MAIGIVPSEQPVESSGEVYIKFRGMKAGADDIAVPELGDIMEFAVTAECVSVGTEKRADGERRTVIGMRVMEVEPGEISKAPTDDQLPFNDDADELG